MDQDDKLIKELEANDDGVKEDIKENNEEIDVARKAADLTDIEQISEEVEGLHQLSCEDVNLGHFTVSKVCFDGSSLYSLPVLRF